MVLLWSSWVLLHGVLPLGGTRAECGTGTGVCARPQAQAHFAQYTFCEVVSVIFSSFAFTLFLFNHGGIFWPLYSMLVGTGLASA